MSWLDRFWLWLDTKLAPKAEWWVKPAQTPPPCADCWCDCGNHHGVKKVDGRWLCASHAAAAISARE